MKLRTDEIGNEAYHRLSRRSPEADPAASGKRTFWTAPSDGAVSSPIGSKPIIQLTTNKIIKFCVEQIAQQILQLPNSIKAQCNPIEPRNPPQLKEIEQKQQQISETAS